MISQSLSSSCDFSQILWISLPPICPCQKTIQSSYTTRTKAYSSISRKKFSRRRQNGVVWASVIPTDGRNHNLRLQFANSMTRGFKSYTVHRVSDDLDEDSVQLGYSNHFIRYTEDPIIDKLRTQLGAIHPIPSPPINPKISGFFVLFFVIGIVFDKLFTSRNTKNSNDRGNLGIWPQVPTSFSLFLEKDLQRKESVEWVNMVLGKLWKVYRNGLENWIIGLLQPVIDNLQKPDYVERVEIKQFSLGDEPFVVRNVERRTSRDVNDLQYQIGIRYAGGARMLLMLTLKFGIIPIKVPVGVRDFDIDGELWVKLRLIPSEPWVGAVSWAFVSLPKIKFELSPFRLFNLMAIPVLSMFLKKLLTEDLPRLFVRPKKIVLDFQKEKTVGSIQNDFKPGEMQERNRDFVGELSVTLVDARNLSYMLQGKTDPYVVLRLGDQVLRSKKNSQTTVIGAPGRPIWNQDFYMLVTNPRKQKLSIQVKDSLGFTDLTIGAGEIVLGSLKDTVPTDKIITLQGGWGPFKNRSAGEILLRLTYKAYVEDEEDERIKACIDTSRSFIDALSALILSEEFEKIVASDTTNRKSSSNLTISASDLANSESGSRGLVLLWLALITSISILTAIINIGGLNVFNL